MFPNCKLCQNKPADKKGSHIIPKFLSKGRLIPTEAPNPKERQGLKISSKGETKVQDTPKADNIFCKSCERRFQHIETLLAPRFREILLYESNPDLFNHNSEKSNGQELTCIEHLELPTVQLRVFLFTIIWRVSISADDLFKNFNLSPEDEEKIRVYLDSILKDDHESLLKSFPEKDSLPFTLILIKSKEFTDTPQMGLGAVSSDMSTILMGDIIIMISKDSDLANSNPAKTPILLCENEKWIDFFRLTIQ